MIELYYTLVKMGRRTIEQVPTQFRVAVQELLAERG